MSLIFFYSMNINLIIMRERRKQMELAAYLAFLFIFVEGLTVLFFPEFIRQVIAASPANILRLAAFGEIMIAFVLLCLYSYR